MLILIQAFFGMCSFSWFDRHSQYVVLCWYFFTMNIKVETMSLFYHYRLLEALSESQVASKDPHKQRRSRCRSGKVALRCHICTCGNKHGQGKVYKMTSCCSWYCVSWFITVPLRNVSGQWAEPLQPSEYSLQRWASADAIWPQNGWPRQGTTGCLAPIESKL